MVLTTVASPRGHRKSPLKETTLLPVTPNRAHVARLFHRLTQAYQPFASMGLR